MLSEEPAVYAALYAIIVLASGFACGWVLRGRRDRPRRRSAVHLRPKVENMSKGKDKRAVSNFLRWRYRNHRGSDSPGLTPDQLLEAKRL